MIHESPVSQIERFVYLSSDIIEELLELSPPDDVSEGLGKFREHIKPMLQGFIRTAERWRALDHQKQQLVTNLAEVTERVSIFSSSSSTCLNEYAVGEFVLFLFFYSPKALGLLGGEKGENKKVFPPLFSVFFSSRSSIFFLFFSPSSRYL